jgi:hypothetical protein
MRSEFEAIEPLETIDELLEELELDPVEEPVLDPLWFHVTALRLFAGCAGDAPGECIQRLHLRPAQRRRRVPVPVWIC